MVPKVKKEAPASLKTKAKAKALKAKKAMLKGVHRCKKKEPYITHLWQPRILWRPRQPRYPWKSGPRRNKLDHRAIIKFPLTTESARKKTEDNNTFVFTVDVKVSKCQTKQAVRKLHDFHMAKVNTPFRPDGEKKVYVRLAPNYGPLFVANKIGII
ncbi:60S ribosomal protein L23a-like [Nycticebus coucang]|uniref:60S ribosomal protein L23a-like n=1 Tax=Nycticebus coucang TaxID=9470 RepID=UPI00234D348C|nr:60S ribosomal protein L23a-like [Nycticebus coucang]